MSHKILMVGFLLSMGVFTSCNQASEKIKEEGEKAAGQANEKVQQSIRHLGLMDVEEGAR